MTISTRVLYGVFRLKPDGTIQRASAYEDGKGAETPEEAITNAIKWLEIYGPVKEDDREGDYVVLPIIQARKDMDEFIREKYEECIPTWEKHHRRLKCKGEFNPEDMFYIFETFCKRMNSKERIAEWVERIKVSMPYQDLICDYKKPDDSNQ